MQPKVEENPEPEILNCSEISLNQFLVPGLPKKVLIVGFPKSGAIWLKDSLDNLLPYYYRLVSYKVKTLKNFFFSFYVLYVTFLFQSETSQTSIEEELEKDVSKEKLEMPGL